MAARKPDDEEKKISKRKQEEGEAGSTPLKQQETPKKRREEQSPKKKKTRKRGRSKEQSSQKRKKRREEESENRESEKENEKRESEEESEKRESEEENEEESEKRESEKEKRERKKPTRKPRKLANAFVTEKEVPVSKSGSDWTEHELTKFSIFFERQDFTKMFSAEERANAILSEELKELKDTWQSVVDTDETSQMFSNAAISKCKSKLCRVFWHSLRDVQRNPGLEQYVDDLVMVALILAGVSEDDKSVHQKGQLELRMANEKRYAKPDVYVADENHTFLLVHEDKSEENEKDNPFAQVAAEAIAAFQSEQRRRTEPEELPRLPPLTKFPILLGVCQGSHIWFMRAEIPWHVALAVQEGKHVREVDGVKIFRYPSGKTRGLSFLKKSDFDQILSFLACWAYVIHNTNFAQYEEKVKKDD